MMSKQYSYFSFAKIQFFCFKCKKKNLKIIKLLLMPKNNLMFFMNIPKVPQCDSLTFPYEYLASK